MWILFYLSFIQIWFGRGGFDRERWRKNWHSLFDDYDLIHNNRKRIKIEVSSEGDAAFAVVDIDTRWRHKVAGEDFLGKDVFPSFIQDAKWRLTDHLPDRTFALSPSVSSRKNNSSVGYHLSSP